MTASSSSHQSSPSEVFSLDHMVFLIKDKIESRFKSIDRGVIKDIIKHSLVNANVVVSEKKIFEIECATLPSEIEKSSVKRFKPMSIAVEMQEDLHTVQEVTLAIGKVLNLNRLPDSEDLANFYAAFPLVQTTTSLLTDAMDHSIETATRETVICTFFYKYFNNGGKQRQEKTRDDVNAVVTLCDGINEINSFGGQFPVTPEYVDEIIQAWEVSDEQEKEYRQILDQLLDHLSKDESFAPYLEKIAGQRRTFIDKGEVEKKEEWDLIQQIIDDELDNTEILTNLNDRKELDEAVEDEIPRFLVSPAGGENRIIVANKPACDFFLDGGVFLDYSSNSLLDTDLATLFNEEEGALSANEEEVAFAYQVLNELCKFLESSPVINVDSFWHKIWDFYEKVNGHELTTERFIDLRTFLVDGQEVSIEYECHEISKRKYIDVSFHAKH